MDIVKVKRDITGGDAYLHCATGYVHDKKGEAPLSLSGNGVDPYSKRSMHDQMYDVKAYFGKTSGNQIVHIIVIYDNTVRDPATACRYTELLASYYADRFQTVQCTHYEDHHGKSFYHTHIVVNSVSFVNGMMFHSGWVEMQRFCDYVSMVTGHDAWLDFEKTN